MEKHFYYNHKTHHALEAVRSGTDWIGLPIRVRSILNKAIEQISLESEDITYQEIKGMMDQAFMFSKEYTEPTWPESSRHAAATCLAVAKCLELTELEKRVCGLEDAEEERNQIKKLKRQFAEAAHLVIMTRKGFSANKKAKACSHITNGLLGVRLDASER